MTSERAAEGVGPYEEFGMRNAEFGMRKNPPVTACGGDSPFRQGAKENGPPRASAPTGIIRSLERIV